MFDFLFLNYYPSVAVGYPDWDGWTLFGETLPRRGGKLRPFVDPPGIARNITSFSVNPRCCGLGILS